VKAKAYVSLTVVKRRKKNSPDFGNQFVRGNWENHTANGGSTSHDAQNKSTFFLEPVRKYCVCGGEHTTTTNLKILIKIDH